METIEYIQADRKREEHRGYAGYRLGPHGRDIYRRGPRTALITRCDLGKAFHVNFDDRQYTAGPLQAFPTRDEIRARAEAVEQPPVQAAPTVLVETETVDTGERRELVGRPARHVITTRRVIPLTGSKCQASQTVTDGWYIDLDTRVSCDPWWWSSGSGHGFLSIQTEGEPPERPTFNDIGEPERGYVVLSRSTPGESVHELEVTHLSTDAIDPAVFEVPANFSLAEWIRQDPVPPLVIRLKQAYDRLKRIAFRFGPALFAAIMAATIPVVAQQPQTFRSEVQTVAVYATVRDHDGHLVPNLTKQDFQIIDDGRPAQISIFSNEFLPITLVLMLDLSGNMLQDGAGSGHDNGPDVITTEQERHLNVVTQNVPSRYLRVRDAAAHLVDLLAPQDRVRIGTLSNQEVALSPLLTSDKAVLHRILREELWPLGTARLWNGLNQAMDSIANEPARKVVLVFSSGLDRCPSFISALRCVEPKTVSRQAVAGEFMIYAIGLTGRGLHDTLTRLAEDTGGGHFVLRDDAELTSVFERVVDELHHQYAIGFVPVVRDGKTHTLELKLAGRGLTARARKRYVASTQ